MGTVTKTVTKIDRRAEYRAKLQRRSADQDRTGREIDGKALAKAIVICAVAQALVLWWLIGVTS